MSATRIEIVAYKKEWLEQFAVIKKSLEDALGSLALSIDHIGSTSVPGLRAKDRIDVQITLAELSPAIQQRINESLVARGWDPAKASSDHRPIGDATPDEHWQKYYAFVRFPQCEANIHMRRKGMSNWRYPILFRDYLRSHPEMAEAYARVKDKLAQYLPENRDAYSDIKDPVCDMIMMQAESWAARTAWEVVVAGTGPA